MNRSAVPGEAMPTEVLEAVIFDMDGSLLTVNRLPTAKRLRAEDLGDLSRMH